MNTFTDCIVHHQRKAVNKNTLQCFITLSITYPKKIETNKLMSRNILIRLKV